MPVAPVPLTALGRCSVGAVVWRQWDQLFLTAIVKASFALIPEGRMVLVDPDPLVSAEQPEPSGHGLHAAGELAPYLGQVDVWLTGHAEVPPRYPEPALHVWLAVVQQGAVRVDKRVDVYAAVHPADPHPQVEIHGLDPISRQWPVRRRLLGSLDPQRLEAPVIELPGAFDWRYYHAVPADQRLEAITGDEWIVLGGVLLRRPRLRTQLPAARGVARLYRRGAPREGAPVELRADMIEIDVDRLRCAIVWRGHVPIASEAELEGLHLVGAVEAPGEAIAWRDPFAARPRVAPTLSDEESPLEHTVAIPGGIEEVLAGEALAEEEVEEVEEVEEEAEREPTMVLDVEGLSSGEGPPAGARPAMTMELPAAAGLLAGQRAALPFVAASPYAEAGPAAAPLPFVAARESGTGTTADVPEDVAATPSTPFRKSAPPPAPVASSPEVSNVEDGEGSEGGLGAQFLAAMEDVGEKAPA